MRADVAGREGESAQHIRNEDGKLRWKLKEILKRCRQCFAAVLNTTLAALDQTIMEGLSLKPAALSLDKAGAAICGQNLGHGTG